MSEHPASVHVEIAELREEVDSLRVEVSRLRRGIAEVKAEQSLAAQRRELDSVSESGYSLVSEADYSYRGGQSSREASSITPVAAPSSPGLVSEQSGVGERCVLSWAERENIADGIGLFLARSLAGAHRGSSGRDKIPLQSRLWIICRDFNGQIYSPVKVVRSWSSCKILCKPGPTPGDSVFVGVPSEREARRIVATAGLRFPQAIEP